MRQDIRLGTFDGIEVGLNWSVVVILALFVWELAAYVLPSRPGHVTAADWVAAVVGAVVLLLSVLAHEFAHAVVARHNEVKVRSVTLFVFGGIAQLEGEAHTPGADFRIAAVGPATSAALAGVFGAMEAVLVAAGGHGLPVAVLSWLWQINLLLAIFNLIPGAPLDGGRVLRAALWRRWGDRGRASVAAAHAGRGVGGVLIALGVLAFVGSGERGRSVAGVDRVLRLHGRGSRRALHASPGGDGDPDRRRGHDRPSPDGVARRASGGGGRIPVAEPCRRGSGDRRGRTVDRRGHRAGGARGARRTPPRRDGRRHHGATVRHPDRAGRTSRWARSWTGS